MKKLTIDFYNRDDVVMIAKELLGKVLITEFDGVRTTGRIVETEAYMGLTDKASHAYEGKRTARNEHMYAQAGTSYIYICYGMHQMFNIVTNKQNIPDAVLIRAVEPVEGIDSMLQRTGKKMLDNTLTKGPGSVGKAMGFHKRHSGKHLAEDEIYVAEDGFVLDAMDIGASARIGVSYAEEDALLPYRFYVRGNKYVSGRPTK